MTLYNYLKLDEQLQYQVIWEIGKYLETIAFDGKMHLLYAINDFYVAVIYAVNNNYILGKNQFKQGEHLDKYLPLLNIEL